MLNLFNYKEEESSSGLDGLDDISQRYNELSEKSNGKFADYFRTIAGLLGIDFAKSRKQEIMRTIEKENKEFFEEMDEKVYGEKKPVKPIPERAKPEVKKPKVASKEVIEAARKALEEAYSSNKREFTKEFFSELTFYETRKTNNRSDIVVPVEIVDEIENEGVSSERLDELTKKYKLPIFKYKTQITIHGEFPAIRKSYIGNYKSLIVNQNRTLGVKYHAVDRVKKSAIKSALNASLAAQREKLVPAEKDISFSYTDNSTSFYLSKTKTITTKEQLDEAVLALKAISDRIPDVFVGSKSIGIYKVPYYGVYVELKIIINAVYEKDLWTLVAGLTDNTITSEQDDKDFRSKIADLEHEKREKDKQDRMEYVQNWDANYMPTLKPKFESLQNDYQKYFDENFERMTEVPKGDKYAFFFFNGYEKDMRDLDLEARIVVYSVNFAFGSHSVYKANLTTSVNKAIEPQIFLSQNRLEKDKLPKDYRFTGGKKDKKEYESFKENIGIILKKAKEADTPVYWLYKNEPYSSSKPRYEQAQSTGNVSTQSASKGDRAEVKDVDFKGTRAIHVVFDKRPDDSELQPLRNRKFNYNKYDKYWYKVFNQNDYDWALERYGNSGLADVFLSDSFLDDKPQQKLENYIVNISNRIFEMTSRKQAIVRGNFEKIFNKRMDKDSLKLFNSPNDVRIFVEYVLDNPDDYTIDRKTGHYLFMRENGVKKLVVVRLKLMNNEYNVRSAYYTDENQWNTKIKKNQRLGRCPQLVGGKDEPTTDTTNDFIGSNINNEQNENLLQDKAWLEAKTFRKSFDNEFGSFTSVFVYVPANPKEFKVNTIVRKKINNDRVSFFDQERWYPIEKYEDFMTDLNKRIDKAKQEPQQKEAWEMTREDFEKEYHSNKKYWQLWKDIEKHTSHYDYNQNRDALYRFILYFKTIKGITRGEVKKHYGANDNLYGVSFYYENELGEDSLTFLTKDEKNGNDLIDILENFILEHAVVPDSIKTVNSIVKDAMDYKSDFIYNEAIVEILKKNYSMNVSDFKKLFVSPLAMEIFIVNLRRKKREQKTKQEPKFKVGDLVTLPRHIINKDAYNKGEIVAITHFVPQDNEYWYGVDIGRTDGQLDLPEHKLKLREKSNTNVSFSEVEMIKPIVKEPQQKKVHPLIERAFRLWYESGKKYDWYFDIIRRLVLDDSVGLSDSFTNNKLTNALNDMIKGATNE